MRRDRFSIDTRTIPADETLIIEGEIAEDIFEFSKDGIAEPSSPLRYKAEVSIVSGNLLVRGRFSQRLHLSCVRCLEPFDFELDLAEHALLVPLENSAVIDLTDALREDILLALPNFPRCDSAVSDGSTAPRECPAAGNFEPDAAFEPLDPESDEPSESDTWGALDKLNLDEP